MFNACDIEGMPERPAVQKSDITLDALIEKLSSGMGVEILTDGGDQAYPFSKIVDMARVNGVPTATSELPDSSRSLVFGSTYRVTV